MNIDNLIEEFNENGWDGKPLAIFRTIRNFLSAVAKFGKQSELDISYLTYGNINGDSEVANILEKKGFLVDRKYDEFDDTLKNYYLQYWINLDSDSALTYICENLLTDVIPKPDGFWLRLNDREELAEFFDSRGRDTTAYDVAKTVLGDGYDSNFGWINCDVYDDVISDLNETNKKYLSDYIYREIGNIDLNVEDFFADFFHELAEVQARDGFFNITSEDIPGLIDDREAIEELLDGDLSYLKDSLQRIYNWANNDAYNDELYSLVFDGLDEFFDSKIDVVARTLSDGRTKWLRYIRIRDFQTDVLKFIEDNIGGRWNESHLEYFGSYTGMMNQLFEDDVYDAIDFRIPDYADWNLIIKHINERFTDEI